MPNIQSLKKITQHFSLLYVEDDESIRKSTTELFSTLFKSTTVAKDGKEALTLYTEYFKNHSCYFDIIITDMQMPFMNGIELSKEIFTINKKQKILIVSAYDDKEYLIQFINIGIEGFLHKPLTTEQIISTLYESCHNLAQEKNYLKS